MSPTYSVCAKDGYLSGEQPICPHCGGKTEVYSRITGYYRPVQNWNDGKVEEYNHRKTYDINNSHLTHCVNHDEPKTEENKCECTGNKIMLFGTKTCPNCKMAKMMLDGAHIAYEWIDAEENVDLTKKFGIKSAPTLVVMKNDGFTAYENASNIKAFTENYKG